MWLASQFLNLDIHMHLRITGFKYNWKSYELCLKKFTEYGTPQQAFT